MKPLGDSAIARLREITSLPDFTGTRYTIVREIARGGMGVVYEADDRELNRRVAIKVVPIESASAEAAQRLRDEAMTIAALEHPGIIPLHDAGTLPDGRAWYAMKLVRGKTLTQALDEGTPLSDLLRVVLRVCETVGYAHAHGRVHGDLKPDNIMTGEFGEVMVMDWGSGAVGTRGFMSPEQERRGPIDARADVYALGTILGLVGPAVRPLRSIAAKARSETREDRYADARELAAEVIRFVDGEKVLAHRESLLEKADRWLTRHRALVALVLAYMIMRVIVFLWVRL